MKKRLPPNGVAALNKRTLKKKSKGQFLNYLKKADIKEDKIDPFLCAMDKAKSEYFAMRELMSKCKPSDVRDNLKGAQTQVIRLIDKLNALDANSRLILSEIADSGVADLYKMSNGLLDVLNQAYMIANSYQDNGRLIEYDKRQLVNSIADSIESILELPANGTREGALEQCAAMVLTDITGRSADGIHTLIEIVVKDREKLKTP